MCGICGLATRSGPVDPERLRAMSATLVHRGPDSDGELLDGPVALAARRLSIIDLEGGDQPIANEDGTVHVVQNGEIYNFRELRAELEQAGHRFSTRSDTEVLVHLYEEHGEGFAERLRGMFAVAIWDSRRRRLVVARDRFGIKPLYYRDEAGELVFASELRALPARRGRPGRARGVPRVQLGAGAVLDLRRNAQAARRTSPRLAGRRDAGRALRTAGAGARCATRIPPSWPRSCARVSGTPCGRT